MKPAREVIEVNFEELEGLLERARREPLGEQDYQKLEGAIHALNYLIELIGEKDTTISCLRALLVKPSTEKTSKVLEQAGLKTSPKSSCPLPGASANQGEKPKPGHGRNGAAAYRRGADQNPARFHEAWGSLSGVLEGEGLRAEGTGPAHPGGGLGRRGG